MSCCCTCDTFINIQRVENDLCAIAVKRLNISWGDVYYDVCFQKNNRMRSVRRLKICETKDTFQKTFFSNDIIYSPNMFVTLLLQETKTFCEGINLSETILYLS